MYTGQEVKMIHYDNEARLLFARERAQLLQNEMRAARHSSSANPRAVLVGSLALLGRALRMRRERPSEATEAWTIGDLR
jgi:hypothetical protein